MYTSTTVRERARLPHVCASVPDSVQLQLLVDFSVEIVRLTWPTLTISCSEANKSSKRIQKIKLKGKNGSVTPIKVNMVFTE